MTPAPPVPAPAGIGAGPGGVREVRPDGVRRTGERGGGCSRSRPGRRRVRQTEGAPVVDGVAGVNQRISQIQSRLASLAPVTAPVTTPRTTTETGSPGGATTFEATLAKAVGAQGTRTSGRLTKDGVPTDLVAYGNGKVPSAALSPIGQGQHRLWGPAAQSFTQLSAAAARDGVRIKVTDSYRSYDQQVDLARRKGLYSQGGLAAKPGTSTHGLGLSVDLQLYSRALAWVREHGAEFGFVEDVPRDPWHWTFRPAA